MIVSLSIAGLHAHAAVGPWQAGVRSSIGWVAESGFRSVHLDASAPEIRPRSLDRSARRDLAATIRRAGLGFSGLDLWIPATKYTNPEHADRAHAALLGAIGLASDLAALVGGGTSVVSATLPPSYAGLAELGAHADAAGAVIEDFAIPARPAQNEEAEAVDPAPPAVCPGFDTARAILRGEGPGKQFAAWSKQLATLRLNDADDTGRRAMGAGTLDVRTLGALHTTLTPSVPIITDVRGLEHPARAVCAAFEALGPDGPGLQLG